MKCCEYKKNSQQNLTCNPGSLVVPDRFFGFWSSGIARCDWASPLGHRNLRQRETPFHQDSCQVPVCFPYSNCSNGHRAHGAPTSTSRAGPVALPESSYTRNMHRPKDIDLPVGGAMTRLHGSQWIPVYPSPFTIKNYY